MATTIPKIADSYDFVVIGGGTSGLTVATRLSESPEVQVLVLEAGKNHLTDPRVMIPALCMQAPGSDLDWQFVTEPQQHLKGRTIKQPQGRLLGGSSGINNQAFICPSSTGIDSWAKLGNVGWGWDTMAPYYRKFYTLNLPDEATSQHLGLDYITDEDREARGPIQVSYTGVVQDPLSKAWIDTLKLLRHGMNGDPYSGKSVGGYSNAATLDPVSKTRSYVTAAYYAPVAERPNLHVLTEALVESITFNPIPDTEEHVAKSIKYYYQGESRSVGLRKEVIVAAGVFQSPKILELSGIGDSHLLDSLKIPVVINNPNVGENLQDHIMTGVSFEVNDGVMTGDSLMRGDPEAIKIATQLYQEYKAGPMTVGGIASHAFMPMIDLDPIKGTSAELTQLLNQYPPTPENKMHYDAIRAILEAPDEGVGALFMFLAQTNLHNDASAKDYLQNLQPGNFVSLGANQSHVFSRGASHIVSIKPSDPPKIDPRYLSHPLDIEIMARHVQFLEKLARSSPLSEYIKPNGKRNHPTAYVEDLDMAKDYIRTTALSNYHPSGTCAMLPKAQGGVVDHKLRVYGTQNVRIVDASIMPLIPRANPQSSVYAVAERAADLIKMDYKG